MNIVVAFDKFRDTISAADACSAASAACCDHTTVELAMSDGGEGILNIFGGPNRTTTVTGPHSQPVEARWYKDRRLAVIESAQACGIEIAGGPESNDAVAATSRGLGQLIVEARSSGCRELIIGIGGTATTDGGLAAIEELKPTYLAGLDVTVLCDVETRFVDAARDFAPQKGATPAQQKLLTRRLEQLVHHYEQTFGINISSIPGSGAGGGIAGGLAAIGAQLSSGFDYVAEELGLEQHLRDADLIVTGEGYLDDESFHGKVVGGICATAPIFGVPVVVIAGEVEPDIAIPPHVQVISLTEQFGVDASFADTATCITTAMKSALNRTHIGKVHP